MTNKKRRPGPESTLDEVREQLVDAAIDDLRRRGVDIGLSHIKLSDAIVAAGVTRTTAYRSLADENSAPQEVLHREVLRDLLSRNARDGNLTIVGNAVMHELAQQKSNFESDDVVARTASLRALIRVGAEASYYSVARSTERSILTAAYGALLSSQADDWRVDAIAEGETNVTHLFSELYLELSEMFQYRLRSEYEIMHFTSAAAAAVEGLAMRHGLNKHLDGIVRATGTDGALQGWTLYGVTFEALFTTFFEPTNRDDPFADLARY